MTETELADLSDPDELNFRLHEYEREALYAVEALEARLLEDGQIKKEDVIDVIEAADNLKGAALEVGAFADLDLE